MSESAAVDRLTVEDLPGLPDDDYRYELVAGNLVREPPPGGQHGGIAGNLVGHLFGFLHRRRLGRVFGEAGYVLASDPDTVRAPDLSFVSTESLERLPQRGPYRVGAPDLAVEVLSPSNTRWEIEVKVEEYLAAGARAVWVVDPQRQTVVVHLSGREPQTLGPSDTLDGGEYLPGFRLPVAEIFEA